MKQLITKQKWLELLAEQSQSELSVAAFCRNKDINPKSFYNHSRKARQATQKSPAFIRTQLAVCRT